MDNYWSEWCAKWMDSNIDIIMADFNSKYTGEQVEQMLDQIANGEIGGGGIPAETDPIFSASAAAGITASDIAGWNNKVDKVDGKGLSTEDFTTVLKQKLEGLSNYDDTELSEALSTLRGDFDKLVSGDTTTAIKNFNEIIAFLDGIEDTQDLSSIIASIEQQIAGKMDEVTLATVATSGSYNDLSDKPPIPSAVTESTVSEWGFTKNTGTVTGVKINGSTKSPDSNGLVDLGTIESGGGSSSGAYPIVDIDLAEINELSPNTYYRFLAGWNSLESAEFVLLPPSDTNIVNEYVFEYYNETGGIGGGSVMPFVFPEEIMWEGGNAPSFSKDYTIVSIVNNLGVFAEF